MSRMIKLTIEVSEEDAACAAAHLALQASVPVDAADSLESDLAAGVKSLADEFRVLGQPSVDVAVMKWRSACWSELCLALETLVKKVVADENLIGYQLICEGVADALEQVGLRGRAGQPSVVRMARNLTEQLRRDDDAIGYRRACEVVLAALAKVEGGAA